MAPHHGLVHLKEYDIKDSNVELIGSDLDHKVKHASAETEPAWNDGRVGISAGLFVWRIENFTVVPVPESSYGQFYDGDSYIILHSQQVQSTLSPNKEKHKLTHDIYFYLGAHTTLDEAGTAAYKTVELDAFLNDTATQHRELQSNPSSAFLALFPHLTIRRGGVASGFRHVQTSPTTNDETMVTLLRVFRHPTHTGADAVTVYEVEPTWQSLDGGDVFILENGGKIWVWQGKGCSPMERARAAQVVHEMRMANGSTVDVEDGAGAFRAERPFVGDGSKFSSPAGDGDENGRKLFRLSDESGELAFALVKDGGVISRADLDSNDVFVLDDGGKAIWVWEAQGASRAERAMWLKVAQAYVRKLQGEDENGEAYLTPIAKVREGSESVAFSRAVEAV